MSAADQKRITIRLPEINTRLIVGFFFLLSAIGASIYYIQAIRPYLWLSSAKTQVFSSIVSSDVGGRIAEMGPVAGETVVKGQTLFTLDRELLLAKRAHLKKGVDLLAEQVRQEKELMGKAMEGYLSASADLDLGIGSPESLQKHLTQMQDAQGKSEKTATLLSAAQTKLAILDIQAEKMVFAAPFSGTILDRTKNLGSAISPGETVYTVADTNNLWVEAELSEKQLSQVKLGTLARVRVPAFPNREWRGKVTWIGPEAISGAIPVKISLENVGGALKPGLSAEVGLKVR